MKKIDKTLPLLIFRCLALGLGLGVLSLLGIDKIEIKDAIWLLALAVTCLAACSLGEHSK
ncbi:MAG: hypothetical protein MJZ96_06870 [Paludibacteraceae bacterium]|nr:hypothetical protein [Paludibacteraceae bacterium]